MKKTLLICIILLLSFSLSQAQTDTTKYDLGRLQIDKKLTQAITIKAADLEKMPFANLSDAINTWLYGVYGGQQTFVPVVDGIVMTDVNALSIYDIDEITLVQNAATALNAATPQQLLLLIKTRRNRPGKSGIEVAGQTNIVKPNKTPVNNNSSYTVKNTSQFYNQYYLSGYVNTSHIHAGLSANYQHDAMPITKFRSIPDGDTYSNGYAQVINQYKFNGYIDANLGKSVLSISTGYVPQTTDGSGVTSTGYEATSLVSKVKNNLYYNNISLKSSLSGFRNTFAGSYEHYKSTLKETWNDLAIGYPSDPPIISGNEALNTANNYLIKDNLSYTYKSTDWEIEPNINFNYGHYRDTMYQSELINSGSSSLENSMTSAYSIQKRTLLTPALNINYRRVFALQGGFEILLSKSGAELYGYKPKKAYPFASVMLNIMELSGERNSSTGLSIFGSYASSGSYTTSNLSTVNFYTQYSEANNTSSSSLITNITAGGANPYKVLNQWQTGATLGLFNNKLIFNYTYNSRSFNTTNANNVYTPYFGNYYYYYYTLANKLITHRFEFDINWFKSNKLYWQTNLNISYVKTMFTYPDSLSYLTSPYKLSGITQKNHIVTGGIVNRLNFKKTFIGADILYVFHETAPYSTSSSRQYYNAINLQNLYAGLRFNINPNQNLEIFANARSIAEDRSPALLDTRKYYGLGFKLGI